MQQIAAFKSNLAAIGVAVEQKTTFAFSQSEEFRHLLKQKKQFHDNPVEPIKPPTAIPYKTTGADESVKHREDVNKRTRQPEPQANRAQTHAEAKSSPQAEKGKSHPEESVESSPSSLTKTEDGSQTVKEKQASEAKELAQKREESDAVVKIVEQIDERDQQGDESGTNVDWVALLEQASLTKSKLDTSNALEAAFGVHAAEKLTTMEGLEDYQSSELEALLAQLTEQLSVEQQAENTEQQSFEKHQQIMQLLAQLLEQHQSEAGPEYSSDIELDAALLATLLKPENNADAAKTDAPDTGESRTMSHPGVALLPELDATQLDQVLTNLADRLEQAYARETKLSGAEGQRSLPELFTVQNKKQFLHQLKDAVLSHTQAGESLNPDKLAVLTEDALQASLEKGQMLEALSVQVNHAVSALHRSLEFAQNLSSRLDQYSQVPGHSIDRSALREVATSLAVAQSRQLQQHSIQERAVNILRPEGLQQLTERVRFMMGQQNMQADIRLDPPELGSMKIRINLSGEAASVNFVVQSQQAREALEHATPRLKELLEEQGIELGQSSVEQESNHASDGHGGGNGSGTKDEDALDETQTVVDAAVVNGSPGAIDYFV